MIQVTSGRAGRTVAGGSQAQVYSRKQRYRRGMALMRVAKASAVTWEKDFARPIVDKIVAYTR